MIVFDLETTGLPYADGTELDKQPKIIELGAIKLDDDLKEISRLEFFCNPGHELPPRITTITGITDEMLKDAKPFIAHYRELCDFFLGERSLAAHNLSFDSRILRFELERIDKQFLFPWPYEHICTMEIAEKVWGGVKRKLGDIYEALFGNKLEGAHRAMSDVEATVKVVEWYKKEGHL